MSESYSRLLCARPDLPMDIVYLLDKVQKNEAITQEHAAKLHELKLVEGRYPHLSITNSLAIDTEQEVSYTQSKDLNEEASRPPAIQMLSEASPPPLLEHLVNAYQVQGGIGLRLLCAISEHGASASLWPRLLES